MDGDAVTRHGYLELAEERGFMREGYEFLDEKRLMLAKRILAEHQAYRALRDALHEAWNAAALALGEALSGAGLHALAVAEAPLVQATLQPLAEHSHLGVPQLRVALEALPAAPENAPLEPRPRCASAFARVVEVAQLAAASAGNLQRLVTEYRRTDRRARALENVVLPEVEQRLQRMAAVLEDLELEEVARVRLAVARQVT